MNPIDKKYADLVLRLYEQTLAKKLKWDPLANDDVMVFIGQNGIALSSIRNVSNEPFEKITIYKSGSEVDAFTDGKFGQDEPPPGGQFENYYALMTTTRLLALRQAKGADDALDQILNDLGS